MSHEGPFKDKIHTEGFGQINVWCAFGRQHHVTWWVYFSLC